MSLELNFGLCARNSGYESNHIEKWLLKQTLDDFDDPIQNLSSFRILYVQEMLANFVA